MHDSGKLSLTALLLALPLAGQSVLSVDSERAFASTAAMPAPRPGGFFEATGLGTIEGGFFGDAVAIQGNTAVVGAPHHSGDRGRVYVFEKGATGWADATRVAVLTASDAAVDHHFGISVDIQGNTLVVGAYRARVGNNAEQGALYVFEKPAGGWTDGTENARLIASNGNARSWLGWSAAVHGNAVVGGAFGQKVGANAGQGAVYVFVRPASGWVDKTENAMLTAADGAPFDGFGISVQIQGITVVAGAPGANIGLNSNQGAVYVFERPSGQSWLKATEAAKLTASDGRQLDALSQVDLDGNTLVAGAPGADLRGNLDRGAAYVFQKPQGGWADALETAKLTSSDAATVLLGDSVAIRGSIIVAGAPISTVGSNSEQGAVHVFHRPPSGWGSATEDFALTTRIGRAGQRFGDKVAIDGAVLAGAPVENQAYVFEPLFGPPTVDSAFPDKVESYASGPRTITVTGQGLHTTTAVHVGAHPMTIDSASSTSLTFTLPSPFGIANHSLVLTNSVGPSNALELHVRGSHPSRFLAPPTHPANATRNYEIYTDRSWLAVYVRSLSNRPSILPGIVSFGIGNGFSQLEQVVPLTADTRGYASIPITNPGGIFGVVYWQVLTLDPMNPVLPLEVSNFQSVFYP